MLTPVLNLWAAPNDAVSTANQTLRSTAEPARLGRTLAEEGAEASAPPSTYQGALNLPPSQVLSPETAKLSFTLKQIRIIDPTIFTAEELLCPFQETFGKTITLNDLQAIAQRITTRYQQAGYILTQVIIPPQHIKEGVVTLQVVSGYIDKVEFSGKICPEVKEILLKYAESIQASRPLQLATLERYTLLANEIPGMKVNAILKPSKTTSGAADLVFATEEHFESAYANVNNFGTRYLGHRQYMFGLEEDSWLKAGDSSQLQVVTTGNSELNFGQLRHTQPIGYEGLRFGMLGRFVRSEPGSILEPFDAKGKNRAVGIDLSYPIIRSRKQNLTVAGGFVVTDSLANILGDPLYSDRIRPIFGSLLYTRVDNLKGFNRGEFTLTQGLKILKASGASNISRSNGQSEFTKLNANATRFQPLPHQFSLSLTAMGQYSFQPLLSLSQFGFGGSEIGRGYDPSEILGNQGIAGSAEFQYNATSASKIVPSAQYYIFYDIGKVWNTDPTIPHASAASTGIGVRLEITKHGRASFYLAKPLTRNVLATGNRNIRVFFTITLSMS